MEKIYKTMRNTGAASIAVGVIVASVGLAAGIIAIVNGALLLKRKSEITCSCRWAAVRGRNSCNRIS